MVAVARPTHWLKNILVLAGVALAYHQQHSPLSVISIATIVRALVATCCSTSSNYVINEILDAPADRCHPRKRYRPLARGELSQGLAYAEWIGLALVGLGIATTINGRFFAATLALLLCGVLYNVPPARFKELPYLDALAEGINSPIRILIGWVAVLPEQLPDVFLLLAFWMAGGFVMALKRLVEYRSFPSKIQAAAYRGSFCHYDTPRLVSSIVAYALMCALAIGVYGVR
jgi:4-hydroxybenzoate polyprenyltransferase